jgi:predicted nucleotidyltransferase
MPISVANGLGFDSEKARWAMQEVKAFLDPYRKYIHSLILFGSYAMGHATRFSDVDFLVLLKNGEKAQQLSRALFGIEWRHRAVLETETLGGIQFVPFDERGIERLFELSTPLVHAARHGLIMWDDGWFRTVLRRPYPKWPTREAALEAFTKWIVWQYYRSALDIKKEISMDHGPDGMCTKSGKCIGHFSGDILARVLSRMLYVTLPERGFLPLSKREAIAMAVEAYGRVAWRPVAVAMAVLRRDRAISHREFSVMFPFARNLFGECIRICGARDPRVLEALRRNAEIRKHLRKIERAPENNKK